MLHCRTKYSLWKMAVEGTTSQGRVGDESFNNDELNLDMGEGSSERRRNDWPTQSQLRLAVFKLNRDLEEVRSPAGFYHRGIAESMLREYMRDLAALNARQFAKDPSDKRIQNLQKRVGNYGVALAKMEEANAGESNRKLDREERAVLKAMLEDYTRGLEDCLEDEGPENLEAALAEVRVRVDEVHQGMPLDLSETRFDIMTESLSASLEGVEREVAKLSRLQSSGSVQVFNAQCEYVVETLSRTIHDRLRRYNETLQLVHNLEIGEYQVDARQRVFKSVAFSIEALSELARQFQSVVELVNACCKEDWWITALEVSDTLPQFRPSRWSKFSLTIRACEWSIDVVEISFHALKQLLNNVHTLLDVSFKWSDEKITMVLLIDGKPLYEKVEAEEQGDLARARARARVMARLRPKLREKNTTVLESQDASALVTKLVELKAKPRNLVSSADANMLAIADFVRQKLDGPAPEANFLPWTFRINPSSLTYAQYVGSGASGMVAKFKWLGQEVVVKAMKSPGLTKRQFEEEAAVLATAQHPRVVRMLGCAFQEQLQTGSLIMELMEHDLRTVIEMKCPHPGPELSPFSLTTAIDLMLQIGEGMYYLHNQNILHRKLKAKNILVNRARRVRRTVSGAYRTFSDLAPLLHTGESYIAKLAAFGTAKTRHPQETNANILPSLWTAPEVYSVPDSATASNHHPPRDVYSFAMTCFEILTGRVPFDAVPGSGLYERIVAGDRPSLQEYTMPPLLKDLIQRCWATDPAVRPEFADICKTLWQCKVENTLTVLRIYVGQ